MPSFHSNKLVVFSSTALKIIISNNTHNNSHNDNCTDAKASLGKNRRIKLVTSLGYDLKGGTQLSLSKTSQCDHYVNFDNHNELTIDIEICTIAKLAEFYFPFGVDFSLIETNLRTLSKIKLIIDSDGDTCYIIIQLLKNQTFALDGHMVLPPAYGRCTSKQRQIGSVSMEQVDTAHSVMIKGPPADPPDRSLSTNE
jgi:hypothetical protein